MLGSIYMGFKKNILFVEVPPSLDVSIDHHLCLRLRAHHLWNSCPGSRVWHVVGVVSCCVLSSAAVLSFSLLVLFGVLTIYYIYIYWTTLTWCFYVSSSFNTYTKVLMFECFVVFLNVSFSLQFCSCSIVHQKVLPCPASIISASESCRVVTTSATWEPKPSHTSMKHLPPQRK